MQNRNTDTSNMEKNFKAFESAEERNDIKSLQRESTVKAAHFAREILDDPYVPAKIKIALNVVMKTIENELQQLAKNCGITICG